jgi:uncharacterized phage-like protein YoqJ
MEDIELKSCCITGHRNIPEDKVQYVHQELKTAVLEAIRDGYCNYISGFAPGTDIVFAQIIVELQSKYPQITLEAALPYPKWTSNRDKKSRDILSKCTRIGIHSPQYHANCFLVRNRFMVNTCKRVIAVYDGRENGGTVSIMRYASALERDLRIIEI